MTVCIGLIPNSRTVMLLQDSQGTYQQLSLTYNMMDKILPIDDSAIAGMCGSMGPATEIVNLLKGHEYKDSGELRHKLLGAYRQVADRKLMPHLAKYGFNDLREVVSSGPGGAGIDPQIKQELVELVNDKQGCLMGVTLMVATVLDRPQIYHLVHPGSIHVTDGVKQYTADGSGTVSAINAMGQAIERFPWEKELTLDQGLEILIRAGRETKRSSGVGGPFTVHYLTKEKNGSSSVVVLDKRKVNMLMYALDSRKAKPKFVRKAVKKLRQPKVTAEQFADYIKSHVPLGAPFDAFFGLKS